MNLMNKKEFDILLQKFENGQCTPEEILFLEGIVNESIEKHADLAILKDEKELQLEEDRLWNKLNDELFNKPQIRNFTFQSKFVQLTIAALLIVVATFSVYLYSPDFFQPNASIENRGLETKNQTKSNQTFKLPDGSTVLLEKNSSIVVSEDFGKVNRTVFLKGKGFFNVTRNEKKPFLVRIGNFVTEVLGTSFSVGIDSQSKLIEAVVTSGKVSVYAYTKNRSSKKLKGVVLTSNLKAIYNIENQTIEETIAVKPRILVPNIQVADFLFDEIRFGTLRDRLKLFYGVDIIFVNSEIENCLFTGDLRGLDFYEQLDVAFSSINARYELRGSKIFVIGNSCK